MLGRSLLPVIPPARQIPRRFYLIIALLFTASLLNYLDRQTLSVLKPTLKANFHLDDSGYAMVVNAFTFTYAAAYIGAGWLVERVGVRLGLSLSVAGWSLATMGCGLTESLGAFVAFRAILGVFEPGYFPAFIRGVTLWSPPAKRGRWMSVCAAGGTLGAIVAVPLIAWLATMFSWRASFVVPGLIGLVVSIGWWFAYQDPPGVTEAAVAKASLPWTALWKQRALWGIVLARLISDPVWYFCLFWMPGYFQEQRGLSLQEAGRVGWIPFLAANVGAFVAAAYSDRLGLRWGDPLKARRRILVLAALLGPLAILTPHLSGLGWAIAALSGVGVVSLTWLFVLGPLVSDVFPAGNVASVWAIAGAFGAGGAIIFNYNVGHLTSALGTSRMFLILGLLHPLAAIVLVSLVKRPIAKLEARPLA